MVSRMFAAIDSTRKGQQSSRLIEAELIAVANDDSVTSVKVTDTDTKNLVWAKLHGSDERIVQAYNTRVQPRAKAPVWLRQLADGTYEVEGLRSRDGTDFYGEAAGTMNMPELIGELMATVWAARNLKPGRVRLSDVGGMSVYVEAFYHASGYFPGGLIDLTSYIPATTDKQVWCVVYYDPDGDELGAMNGTEYDLPYTMNETDLGAIALSPHWIRLAGIVLTEGDTAITAASIIIAAQSWIDAPVTNDNFFPIHITDTRTIPSNRQQVVDSIFVDTGGILTIDGILRII